MDIDDRPEGDLQKAERRMLDSDRSGASATDSISVAGEASDASGEAGDDRSASAADQEAGSMVTVDTGEVKQQKKKGKKKTKDGKKDGLGSSRGVETMFRTSYRAHLDLTALADNKANIMISINGLMISIILAYIAPKLDANPWLLIPTTTLLLSCLFAIIFAILAARPRVHSGVVNVEDLIENRRNILFFGNYTRLSEDQFLRGVKNMLRDTDRLYVTMVRDLYAMGRVLEKKFKLLRTSYTAFMIGITISVVAFILVFVSEVPR
jgi:hypothetical protein